MQGVMGGIRLLGAFRVMGGTVNLAALPVKAQAVLSYLAANIDQPVMRDRLADLAWSRSGQEQARQSLRQALVTLRQFLAQRGEDCGQDCTIASAGPESVVLKGVKTDLADFERLAASDQQSDLEAALALYGGAFMDGFPAISGPFDEWIAVERARLSALAGRAMGTLAQIQIDAGHHEEAITTAQGFLALDGLREDAHRLLMRCYAGAGRRSDALRQYEQCRQILRRELGVAPDASTTSLAQSLMEGARQGAPSLFVPGGHDKGPEQPKLLSRIEDGVPGFGESPQAALSGYFNEEQTPGIIQAAPRNAPQGDLSDHGLAAGLLSQDDSAQHEQALTPRSDFRQSLSAYFRQSPKRLLTLLLVLGITSAAVYALPLWSGPKNGNSGIADITYQVRPFTVVNDTGKAHALANNLHSRLIGGLGSIPGVRLITPVSETDADTSVKARYVIDGTVSQGAASTRVEARITERTTGKIISTTNLDSKIENLGELEDEILGGVGDDLSVEINKLAMPPPPDSPEKLKAFALAQEARLRVDLKSEPERAIRLYEEATRLSPNYKDIWGWYANALVALGSDAPPGSEQAREYFSRAKVILDTHNADVPFNRLLIYAQCQYFNYSNQPQAALVACNRAEDLMPWSARVRKELGTTYFHIGQLERALTYFGEAESLNHRIGVKFTWEIKAGVTCIILNRNEEALVWLKRAGTLNRQDTHLTALTALVLYRLNKENLDKASLKALAEIYGSKSSKQEIEALEARFQISSTYMNKKINDIINEINDLAQKATNM